MRLPLGMAGPNSSLALHRPAAGAAIRNLNPGYCALVMATGIVSRAMRSDGSDRLSGILAGRPAAGLTPAARAMMGGQVDQC